jgi:hypothetical protein
LHLHLPPGCRSQACAKRVGRAWWLKHHPKAHIASGLEACIIQHESGGDPKAVNGIYEGIGQWEHSRWISDGGGRYAESPLGATYAEQEIILRGEGEAGMIEQQGQYDGCS